MIQVLGWREYISSHDAGGTIDESFSIYDPPSKKKLDELIYKIKSIDMVYVDGNDYDLIEKYISNIPICRTKNKTTTFVGVFAQTVVINLRSIIDTVNK